MSEEVKKEKEKYLDEHGFTYKWRKDYLFIKKIGIGWKIPLVEVKYAVSFEELIKAYTSNKPGYGLRWWEGDTLYSKVVE